MSVITQKGLSSVKLWVCAMSTGNFFYIFPEIKYMFLSCVTWMWGSAIG